MADPPQFLSRRRHRDGAGQGEARIRRVLLGLVGLVCLAGLLNLFGQRPETSEAAAPAASLKVYAASRVRGGLLYEARFTITARRDVENATLVLEPGWLEGITINTIEPGPIAEGSRDGNLVVELGHVRPGTSYILFLQLQVNPTNVGHRSQDVALYDGDRFLAKVDRSVTVFP
jgi:hypothetical protein